MSSFKRKGSTKATPSYTATRVSPSSSSTLITSTGIPSLDDILGGGLPLSCSLLITAPDFHSSYGNLVQKYFIAQGIKSGQRVCVVDDSGEDFVKDLMWTPKASSSGLKDNDKTSLTDGEDNKDLGEEKIKIAWRYEQMKQFQTTVSPSSYSTDDYCAPFDLTNHIPESTIDDARKSGQLSFIPIQRDSDIRTIPQILEAIQGVCQMRDIGGSTANVPIRVCIPSLGSAAWGDLEPRDIIIFLHSLRNLLRTNIHACASTSLPAYLSTDVWGGLGWLQKLGWSCDAALTMSAFSADPSLREIFPNHHGLLHIHVLPNPATLLSPSERFSVLRGLSASTGATGAGENNLAFKSTRKRLVFETLHLDIEGGVGERRTTSATAAVTLADNATFGNAPHEGGHKHGQETGKASLAAVKIVVENSELGESQKQDLQGLGEVEVGQQSNTKPKKAKKSVAFRADRPDLYDF